MGSWEKVSRMTKVGYSGSTIIRTEACRESAEEPIRPMVRGCLAVPLAASECSASVLAMAPGSLGLRPKATEAFSAEAGLRYCFNPPAPLDAPRPGIIKEAN